MTLTATQIRALLHYDPDTGIFTRDGLVAGTSGTRGYRIIRIYGKNYRVNRLAFLYVTGEQPIGDVDHINGKTDDNRWCNLRLATHGQNRMNAKCSRNNKSGLKGVSWHIHNKKWQARITANGKTLHLGLFETPEEAHAVWQANAALHHGEFARLA